MKAASFIPALLVFIIATLHFYQAVDHFTGVGICMGAMFLLISVLMFDDHMKSLKQA